jgi:gamma-glutamyltranspeptidase/glutathione hydrolase
VVDELLAVSLARHVDDLKRYPETARLFLPTGAPPQAGDRFVQEDLARSLYQIAAEGPEVFYEGEIAAQIDSTMQTYDGLITLEDLAAYEPIWREPVHFRFDSLDIYSMALPSSGGLVLGQILEILEPYAFDQYTPDSPGYIRLFAEASRLAFADRSVHMGDPAFYDVPGGLLDSAYLAQRRSLIPESGAGSSSQIGPGTPLRSESPQTTHFSVCDREGNMVALTYTLNGSFGSGVTVIDGGFLLNNEMDDFSIKPGVPNQFGLVGGEANKIEPGKRMLSSMTPTLVLQHGEPLLVLGSPGGSRIISAVAQTILAFTRFDLSLGEAVEQPRVHHQWEPDMLFLEQDGFGVATIQELIRYGYEVEERPPIGNVNAIAIDRAGLMHAVADKRLGGKADGY